MFGKKSVMKRFLLSIIFCFSLLSCEQKQLKWIALGDSITYLNDHQDETGNRITKGYLTLVSEALPHIQYVNKGYNGWTAQRISKEIETLGLEGADIYSVFLGTNDWWRGVPIGTFSDYSNNTGSETFYGSYRIIIDKFRSLNKDGKIVLITPMQRGDFVYIADMTNNAYGSYKEKEGQNLAEFAEAIITIGKNEKLDVVDLYNRSGITLENMVKYKRLKDPSDSTYKNFQYPAYMDIPFNPKEDEYPYPIEATGATYDGLHPSDSGYEIIAKMLIDVL
jgi:lysophospholipase L1-like esterase